MCARVCESVSARVRIHVSVCIFRTCKYVCVCERGIRMCMRVCVYACVFTYGDVIRRYVNVCVCLCTSV